MKSYSSMRSYTIEKLNLLGKLLPKILGSSQTKICGSGREGRSKNKLHFSPYSRMNHFNVSK